MSFGIRGKLISIFLVIKVLPLVLLGGVAWEAIESFGESAIDQSRSITEQMRQTLNEAGELAVADTVQALDDKARETIERLTTDTARDVANFLYQRDSEILFAASLTPNAQTYRSFLSNRYGSLTRHDPWIMNEEGSAWIKQNKTTEKGQIRTAKVEKNAKQFNYRLPNNPDQKVKTPLYHELTYLDLQGQEIIKISTSNLLDRTLKNVSLKANTFLKAEDYFKDLKDLEQGDIYVSDVIGAYKRTHIIGPYTKERLTKANKPFRPEDSAYAGKENPVGQRFEGIIRWATPVFQNDKKIGYVTLALNHDHLMEFTDHVIPTEERYSDISDAASGNYAFMWDHKGRNISHPRDYFIYGYNPETGEQEIPWLAADIYKGWQESGLPYWDYAKELNEFNKPGDAKPSVDMIKQGKVALDCRYLNFAPQCAGWWNLTEEGGSGSFEIFWSGLWKLTTAATIPYYTGQYGNSKRGFGFVTIGANVDEFHRAATETKEKLDSLIGKKEKEASAQEENLVTYLQDFIKATATELTVYTTLMIIIVIAIAIWMANVLSSRIMSLINSLHKIEGGDLTERAEVKSKDEMGELANSLNKMTVSLQKLIQENKEAVLKAEASSQAKTDFLASMSHELRTPLNAVIGFSEVIKSEVFGPLQPKEYHGYIDDIHSSGQHLLTLINDILDAARIGAGEMVIEPEDIDLNASIDASLRMLAPLIDSKSLKLSRELIKLPTYRADDKRIKQVIINLLNNAAKFTPENGEITVSCGFNTSGDIEISVKDTGIGMSKDDIKIALTPFAQVQSSIAREYEGTGLGLPISKNLMEMHGGTLIIESNKGEGTTVTLTLPKEEIVWTVD